MTKTSDHCIETLKAFKLGILKHLYPQKGSLLSPLVASILRSTASGSWVKFRQFPISVPSSMHCRHTSCYKQQDWGAVTDTTWSLTKMKISTIWSFTEECWSLVSKATHILQDYHLYPKNTRLHSCLTNVLE